MRARIVADDLTGAADAAVAFAGRGLATLVRVGLGPPALPAAVVSVATGSRRCDALVAAGMVARAARCLPATGPVVSLKKIDSLLRGPVLAEVAAALRAWCIEQAVIAPAFPAMGRTTVGGIQLLNGCPVPTAPGAGEGPPTSDLRSLLRGLPCVVCDAGTDADLDAIVARHWRPGVLWVGSAGLGAALARRLTGVDRPARPATPRVSSVLVVAGTRHPVTLAQLSLLGADDCGCDPERARAALAGSGVAVLHANRDGDWAAVVEAASSVPADAVVLTGGDTGSAVLQRRGIIDVEVLSEPWPGMPLGRDPVGGGLILMKSGAFGAADALRGVVRWLRGEGPCQP